MHVHVKYGYGLEKGLVKFSSFYMCRIRQSNLYTVSTTSSLSYINQENIKNSIHLVHYNGKGSSLAEGNTGSHGLCSSTHLLILSVNHPLRNATPFSASLYIPRCIL